VFTVNQQIADFYQNKYKVPVKVVRNIAPKLLNTISDQDLSKKIKGNKKMLILQGAGINKDRGAEEAVLMMQYLENVVLYIIGSGDVIPELRVLVKELQLQDKVYILDKMSYESLLEYTKIADLGLSLDKGTNLNYEYSLPNKIFDYIQCLTPILASNREIVAELVTENNIGKVVQTNNPKELAMVVNSILYDENLNAIWRKNLKKTADIYTWEKETKKLKLIFTNLA
jgi:glycosyltransferase involved in cell wall biosynthesis